MSAWDSSGTRPSSHSAIAGFDVRAAATELDVTKPGSAAARLIRLGNAEWRPATLDPQVWPSLATAEMERACNGVNLLPSIDLVAGASDGKDACIVAFAFPAELIQELASTFGLSDKAGTPRLNDVEWRLLGYDVVDIRTQVSAIYSFEWSAKEWADVLTAFDGELNPYGLVDQQRAISQCRVFDKKLPEHSPFAPCAVWVRVAK